jgi:heat shock protein HslJ
MVQFKFLFFSITLILIWCCLFTGCLSTDQTRKGSDSTNTTSSGIIPGATLTIEPSKNIAIGKTLQPPDTNLSLITGTGTVLFQNLEGGAYIIKSDDGHHYQPLSLPIDLKINGTRVSYILRPVSDIVSIVMSGDPVEVIAIEPLPGSRIANHSDPFIEFEKVGGITDSYEALRIFADKHGEVTKWNQVQSINISNEEMNNLTFLCNKTDFKVIKTQNTTINPSPNAMVYTIKFQNQTTKLSTEPNPGSLAPITEFLNSLLEKYTISPISANKTLNGTAWRLSSYLRQDGIQISISNNTRISAIFGKDNIITGSSGCNSYSGHYNLTGTNLSYSQIVVTQIPCQNHEIMETGLTYIKLLGQVRIISGQEKNLYMSDENNTTLLIYTQMSG